MPKSFSGICKNFLVLFFARFRIINAGRQKYMWFGNNIPGESPFGGMYPAANDFDMMSLARLDGKCGRSFYEYFFIGDNRDGMFR